MYELRALGGCVPATAWPFVGALPLMGLVRLWAQRCFEFAYGSSVAPKAAGTSDVSFSSPSPPLALSSAALDLLHS